MGPVGLSETGVPAASVTSPPGWTFRPIGGEEDSLGEFDWEINAPASAIAGGTSLTGFSALLPGTSPACEHGHWSVYLNSAEESFYSWTLEPVGTVSVPASSVNGRNGVRVAPSPMREAARIEYDAPASGEVSVRVFDAEGKTVRNLPGGKAEAGRASVVWDGRDHSGTP